MMATAIDLTFNANLDRVDQFLLLALLAAMVFAGFCYARGRAPLWPRIFGISSAVALLMQGGLMMAEGVQEGLRLSERETPDLAATYETWVILGSSASLLLGMALLGAGVALVYLGWQEGKKPIRAAKKKRAGA